MAGYLRPGPPSACARFTEVWGAMSRLWEITAGKSCVDIPVES